MMDRVRVVILVREGCHLCEQAMDVAREVCGRLNVAWESSLVDADPQLKAQYSDHVPVTLVDGAPRWFWHLDADRLSAALSEPAGSGA